MVATIHWEAVFGTLSPREIEQVAERFSPRRLQAGEALMRAGDQAEELFYIAYGRFRVRMPGETRAAAELGPGEWVGEIGFFAEAPRTADVTASRDSEVMVLRREDFDALRQEIPEIQSVILQSMAARLLKLVPKVAPDTAPMARTLMLCGLGGAPVPEGFAQSLIEALSHYGETRALDAAGMREASGVASSADPRAARWLSETEADLSFLLLIGSPEDETWNALAARQADGAILIADQGDPGAQSPCEREAMARIPADQRRLVATLPAGGTARWMAERDVATWHYAEDPAGFRRLARFIAGKARGLVLSGGGALCGAHVGVVWALIEAGLDFEAYCGASAGGAVGAALAKGMDRFEMIEAVKDVFLTAKSFSKWAPPRHGLLDPATLDAKFAEHYGVEPIENLPRPFFTVAGDLSANALRLLDRGPLWEAVRATCSIPGLLPPFIDSEGRVLIDGGVSDNLPLGPMLSFKAGPNMIISLLKGEPEQVKARYGDYPSRRRLALETVVPFLRRPEPKLPGLGETLIKSVLLASNAQASEDFQRAEVSLAPPLIEGMSILDWRRFEALERRTRDWTLKLLETERPERLALFMESAGA